MVALDQEMPIDSVGKPECIYEMADTKNDIHRNDTERENNLWMKII